MAGRMSSGYGFGSGSGFGYGFGDGYGDGYGYGYGFGDGFGFGHGDGSGSGYGSGFGFGFGFGYGFGFGSGKEIDMRVSGFSCHVFPPWAILKIGCEVHALEHWRKNWQRIADRNDVEVDEKEISSAIAAAEAALGG